MLNPIISDLSDTAVHLNNIIFMHQCPKECQNYVTALFQYIQGMTSIFVPASIMVSLKNLAFIFDANVAIRLQWTPLYCSK